MKYQSCIINVLNSFVFNSKKSLYLSAVSNIRVKLFHRRLHLGISHGRDCDHKQGHPIKKRPTKRLDLIMYLLGMLAELRALNCIE